MALFLRELSVLLHNQFAPPALSSGPQPHALSSVVVVVVVVVGCHHHMHLHAVFQNDIQFPTKFHGLDESLLTVVCPSVTVRLVGVFWPILD
jgi:hypothetical protein